MFCLDIKTGAVIWKIDISSGFLSAPVGFKFDGRDYIAVCARRGLLQCFDVTGSFPQKIWQYQMPHEVLGSPAITIDTEIPLIFLGSKYGNLSAINAKTGRQVWQKMAGNWIDNTACIGEVNGKKTVFAGSFDYNVYAFEAETGNLIWKKPLGGEVYSAPCFFNLNNKPNLVVSTLDNHVYLMNAENGDVVTSFFTGQPIWDKIAKGENLWGSPVVLEAGKNSAIVFGSFNGYVYVMPLVRECSLTAMARSSASLWWGLFVVLILFLFIVVPIVLRIKGSR
ncbi:PQQ-like beta-propeller repeat protein [bacterium]|nr:PQQ-like beta-propeller repeat protein [bacterium]